MTTHAGHRERLRTRFEKSPHALPDYEILEMFLHLALPRKDVKPIAKNLLAHFKTFQEIICSDFNTIAKIDGIGKNTALSLKLIHEILKRTLAEQLLHSVLLNSKTQLIEYLKIAMAYLDTEQLRVLFLNTKYYLIKDEIQQQGTLDHASLYIRDIIKRALDLNSSNVILVHNHPTGDSTPSKADIKSTLDLQKAALPMNVTLVDHIIIAKYGFFSMRDEGLLLA